MSIDTIPEIIAARQALQCLHLAVENKVAGDVKQKVERAFDALTAAKAPDQPVERSDTLSLAEKALFYLKYSHGCWCTSRDPAEEGQHSLGCDYARAAMNATKREIVSPSHEAPDGWRWMLVPASDLHSNEIEGGE